MGFRSGEYLGRKSRRAPAALMALCGHGSRPGGRKTADGLTFYQPCLSLVSISPAGATIARLCSERKTDHR